MEPGKYLMKRILILEDDIQYQKYIETILSAEGYQVTALSDGKQGLAALEEGTFDLLITDVFMPKVDGIIVLLHIRNKYHNMKVICMTGGGQGRIPEEVLNASKTLGAHKNLKKPFTKIKLLPLVRELVG